MSYSIEEHIAIIRSLEKQYDKINEFSSQIANCLKNNGTIFTCGNGGSASDSQHFTAELVGRFHKNRIPLPSVSLNSDSSVLTAIANDFGFEKIFKRQAEALTSSNDLIVIFSTSGNSRNIVELAKYCKLKKIRTLSFLGNRGGEVKRHVDEHIIIKSGNTARIQEAHIFLIHLLCENLEKLFK